MSASAVIRRPFARLRRRRAEESEHGAVAAIVAIMLAGGVLLGVRRRSRLRRHGDRPDRLITA
jgi:hypothetical protein